MKTPSTVLSESRNGALLDFNLASWREKVTHLQKLQQAFLIACKQLRLPDAVDVCLNLSKSSQGTTVLIIKVSAALAARFRQIEPELKATLNASGWPFDNIEITVIRNATSLSQYLREPAWVSPTELRLGPRTRPSPSQRAVLLKLG